MDWCPGGWMEDRMDKWLGEQIDEWMDRLMYGKLASEVLNEPEFPQSNVKLIQIFSLASSSTKQLSLFPFLVMILTGITYQNYSKKMCSPSFSYPLLHNKPPQNLVAYKNNVLLFLPDL